MTDYHPKKIQITQGPRLRLKSDWEARVKAARLVGADQFMSSTNLHRYLDMLFNLVARPVCTSSLGQPLSIKLTFC